jgi:hypothetical protein
MSIFRIVVVSKCVNSYHVDMLYASGLGAYLCGRNRKFFGLLVISFRLNYSEII